MDLEKKPSGEHDSVVVGITSDELGPESWPEERVKRLHRKIDLRILPFLSICYLFMRVDVNNVSYVAIMNIEQGHGIKKQLHLSPQQWTWVIACFFYTYAAFEPVSTLAMKRAGASLWMGRIMITWGIIVCCIAAVQNYGGLIACRVLLGAAESGYYPCLIYYLAFWFPPSELALRIAAVTACGHFSGFVGGWLAFATSFADSLGGLAGWRWLFIIEGVPPIILGFSTLYFLPDFPETASFITEDERKFIISRLAENSPSKDSKTWDKKQVLSLFKMPIFWTLSIVWMAHATGGAGIGYALPTVVYELGLTTTAVTNALNTPPSVITFLILLTLGWLIQHRNWNPFWVAISFEVIIITCYTLVLTVSRSHPIFRYICLIIASGVANSMNPILWPSRIKSFPGTSAAGFAIGLTNAMAQCAGLLGPQVFSPVYGPTYRTSYLVCIGLLTTSLVCITLSGIFMGRLRLSKVAS